MKRTNKSADPRYKLTKTENLRRYEVALHKPYTTKKRKPLKDFLFWVAGGARTHDIQNHNLTL